MYLRKLRYQGEQYYCVCCDSQYSDFLDMKEGSHPRKKVVCPGCGSAERHRLLLHYMRDHEAELFSKNTRILYIAPMHGIRKYFKQMKDIQYIGADLGSSLAEEHFDLESIPYPENSFDFCICSHTLAHVKNDDKALRELERVLSQNAVMLVLDRIYDIPHTKDLQKDMSTEERLAVYQQVDRWRIYGNDFADYLASFGFEVEEVAYGKGFDEDKLAKEVIDVGDVIYVCKKV